MLVQTPPLLLPALQALVDQVRAARADGSALDIRGAGSKDFYGEAPGPRGRGRPLVTTGLAGIRSYEPSELVVSVGAGTPLAELEAVLAECGQCLPFEPPRFAAGGTVGGGDGAVMLSNGTVGGGHGAGMPPTGTVGGMVACGLSGPSRAAVGSVRDYVLGATLLNGRAELLNFGGTVMKNVAGYDVSRVLAGSMGVLGVICEVSLKVLPVPPATVTLRLEMDQDLALRHLNDWAGQPLPLNASAWRDGTLVLRLSGAAAAVQAAAATLGGERIEPALAAAFWTGLRDQRDDFFVAAAAAVERGSALWRLSLPPTAPPLALAGELLIEWGGAQRWLCTGAPAGTVRDAAAAAGGHATLFRGGDKGAGVFTPLKPPLDRIHRELKRAFDPDAIFNPGRLVPGL